jgi:hypothetical protein
MCNITPELNDGVQLTHHAAAFYHLLALLRAVASEPITHRKRLLWVVPSP